MGERVIMGGGGDKGGRDTDWVTMVKEAPFLPALAVLPTRCM